MHTYAYECTCMLAMHMYACIFIRMHIYAYVYIHTYAYICIRMKICVCITLGSLRCATRMLARVSGGSRHSRPLSGHFPGAQTPARYRW